MRILEILPLLDWLALLFFIAGWSGYAMFAHRRGQTRPSILTLDAKVNDKAPARCVLRGGPCGKDGRCAVHDAFSEATSAMCAELRRSRLDEVVRRGGLDAGGSPIAIGPARAEDAVAR